MKPRHPPLRLPSARSSPAGPERATDARTLYLATAEPVRVTSTGEALVVASASGAAQRIPVARVLRVVSNANAEWSGAALLLCLERGVSVSWLGRGHEPAGHMWPCRRSGTELAPLLDVLAADHPGWMDAYGNWLRQQRLQVLRDWAVLRQTAGCAVQPDEWQRAKRAWVYRAELGEVLPPVLLGMVAALVASRLSEQNLQDHYWCCLGEPVELTQDLTHLLWARMNFNAGPLAAAIEHPREAAAVFERWSGTCAGLLQQHLGSLRAHAHRELAL